MTREQYVDNYLCKSTKIATTPIRELMIDLLYEYDYDTDFLGQTIDALNKMYLEENR